MLDRVLFFAARTADPMPEALPPQETSKLFGLSIRDIVLLLCVAAIIALALFLWAYLTRRERRRHLVRSSRVITRDERHPAAAPSDDRQRMRKRRRGHPDNLPRNPTLGETGGLPPIRPDEPAQPAA